MRSAVSRPIGCMLAATSGIAYVDDMNPDIGRIVLVIGLALVVVGGLAALGVKLPFGRLPGDIAIEGERGGFYFPIVTMVIVSVVLTIVVNLFLRR